MHLSYPKKAYWFWKPLVRWLPLPILLWYSKNHYHGVWYADSQHELVLLRKGNAAVVVPDRMRNWTPYGERFFGNHIREAGDIIKDWTRDWRGTAQCLCCQAFSLIA